MFVAERADERLCVELEELTDHPVRVGTDPESDGEVMTELRHVLPGSPGNDDGNDQRGKYHCYAKRLPYHAPRYVFKKPEYDMQVFHLPVTERDGIDIILVVHKQVIR